jgi:broad specificity phosphatase PhoE
MTLIFETHATSVDNETGLASGWYDADLSRAGQEQAREIGERHPAGRLAAVYCSDLRRSYRTGELAYPGKRVPIIRDRRLRECDYGAMTRCPTWLIEHSRGKYVDTPFPRGESYEDVADRVGGWLREVNSMSAGHTILVIGHRAVFFAFEHLLRGVRLTAAVRAAWEWRPGWHYTVVAAESSRPS